MEGRGTTQIGRAEEKREDIASPVDQAAALARMLKILEKSDSRVGHLEARQNGSSGLEALRGRLLYQRRSLTQQCDDKDWPRLVVQCLSLVE